MKTISIVLSKGSESFYLTKFVIWQKSGSLVSAENDRIRIIEEAKI